MNYVLTEDAKTIILLCTVFGKGCSDQSLSSTEYSSLAHWLIKANMRPCDLLQKDNISRASLGSGIDKQRLESLLNRGVQLGFALEEWQQNGIWIISRSDTDYPARYKKHLKNKAPPLLFGVGNRSLLSGGGLSIIGSHHVDQAGKAFIRQVAELCAYNHMPIVSGDVLDIDQISMSAAREAGGATIGILTENLLKKSVERKNRQAIADGRRLLLSPYHPNACFSIETAMDRNTLIYAMSEYGLVVSAKHNKDDSWTGTEKELKRENRRPVFVRMGSNAPQGHRKLLDLGAISWPDSIDRNNFRQQLDDLAVHSRDNQPKKSLSLFDCQTSQDTDPHKASSPATVTVEATPIIAELNPVVEPDVEISGCTTLIYQAVLPVILSQLDSPAEPAKLAEILDVNKTQLNALLQKATDENKIMKRSNPVRYSKMKAEK